MGMEVRKHMHLMLKTLIIEESYVCVRVPTHIRHMHICQLSEHCEQAEAS